MREYIHRRDLWLIGGILALALVLLLWPKGAGERVRLTFGGETCDYPLAESKTLELAWEDGSLTVRIEDGAVWVERSDCPDQVCVRTGRITQAGETIVCLPAEMALEILPGEESDGQVDAVAG